MLQLSLLVILSMLWRDILGVSQREINSPVLRLSLPLYSQALAGPPLHSLVMADHS